jgi:hypothetical protein
MTRFHLTVSHTSKYVNKKLMPLRDHHPSVWHVQCVTISCPMIVKQVLVIQGLGNGSQACDCQHDDGGRRPTKPADTSHIPQSLAMSQHERTTAPRKHEIFYITLSSRCE